MTTIRVWFTKTDEAAYISLLDLQRVMQRAFKRSGLPVWYTLGFNPHIYMTFTAPLSLGQESLVESLDCRTEDAAFDWENAANRLNACLPKGIAVFRVEPAGMDPNTIAWAVYEARYEAVPVSAAQAAYAQYAALEQAEVQKKGKRGVKTVDLKQLVEVLDCTPNTEGGCTVTLLCPAGSTLNVNPILLLQFLETQYGLPAVQGALLRTKLLTKTREAFC